MLKRTWHIPTIALAVLVFAGCSGSDGLNAPGVGVIAPSTQSTYESVIGLAGGLLLGDTAKLCVPVGSLLSPTTFSVTTSVVDGKNQAVFGPNVTFSGTAVISLKKPANAAPGTYHLFQWNDETDSWDDIGGTTIGSWVSVVTTTLRGDATIAVGLMD